MANDTLAIGSRWYKWSRLATPQHDVRTIRLEGDTDTYDVSLTPSGQITCTCPDYRYRRCDQDGQPLPGVAPCKHGAAVLAAELIRPETVRECKP